MYQDASNKGELSFFQLEEELRAHANQQFKFFKRLENPDESYVIVGLQVLRFHPSENGSSLPKAPMLSFVGNLSQLQEDFPARSYIVDFQIVGDHGEITLICFQTTDNSGAVFMALTYNKEKRLFIKMAVQEVPDLKQ